MNLTAGTSSTAPQGPPTGLGEGTLAVFEAAELQDHLLTAANDLDRLQRLLDGACDTLLVHFSRAHAGLDELAQATPDGQSHMAQGLQDLHRELGGAITGLQFQDMATQLIAHTLRRLRACADRLAQGAIKDDEDGAAWVETPPLRPNPVTQDEMDAGSIELF